MWLLSLCACASDLGRTLERIERQVASVPDSAYTALCAIDKSRLSDKGDKALYNLLMSEAMYRRGELVCDDSLIRYPSRYFHRNGDEARLWRSLFIKAIVAYNMKDYPHSMVLSREAEALALSLGSTEYLAKIYEHISNIYEVGLNSAEELKYSTRAAALYKEAGMESEHLLVLVDKARSLAGMGLWQKSIQLLDSVAALASLEDTMLIYSLNKARIKPEIALGKAEDAVESYEIADKIGREAGLDFNIPSAFEISLIRGEVDEAALWLDSIVAVSADVDADLEAQYAMYRYYKYFGDYQKALEHHERLLSLEEEGLRKIRSESVVKAESRFYWLNAKRARQKEKASYVWIVSISIMALVIISTVLFYYRLKVRTKNEEMESKMGQIRELSDEIRAKDNSLFALNKEVGSKDSQLAELSGAIKNSNEHLQELRDSMVQMSRGRFDVINNLCEEYFSRRNAPEKTRLSLYGKVEEQIMNMRSERALCELEQSLNMVYDGIMDKLRVSFPHMKEADRLFLMLTFAGFSSKTISVLCDINLGNYYNKRSRLRAKIEESDSPYRDLLLSAI